MLGVDVLTVPLFPYQREGVAHLLHAGRALLRGSRGQRPANNSALVLQRIGVALSSVKRATERVEHKS
jgi:hypothetical protein